MVQLLSLRQDNTDGAEGKGFCMPRLGRFETGADRGVVETPSTAGESTSHPWAPAFAGVTEKGAGVTEKRGTFGTVLKFLSRQSGACHALGLTEAVGRLPRRRRGIRRERNPTMSCRPSLFGTAELRRPTLYLGHRHGIKPFDERKLAVLGRGQGPRSGVEIVPTWGPQEPVCSWIRRRFLWQ